MLLEILLSAALAGPAVQGGNEEAREAVRELYTYATQSVQVDAAKVQQMVNKIETHLGEPSQESARALEPLAAAAREDDPDGREIRVMARELYRTLADEA